MRLSQLKAERLLGTATFAIGVVTIVSALTPSIASRSEFVHGALPPEVPQSARLVALALGLALVWISAGLARRRRNAWRAAAVFMVVVAVAHVLKGLDAEEATASLLLLAVLLLYRKSFDVRGDPAMLGPLVGTALAVSGMVGFAFLYQVDRIEAPDWVFTASVFAGSLFFLRATQLVLRPRREPLAQTDRERSLVRILVDRYSRGSLDFFALRRDKNYFFSPTGGAFLAYRVIGGTALVSGDPVGDPDEFEPLLADFLATARLKGWRPAVAGGSEDLLPVYRAVGLRSLEIGLEAVLRPREFTLEGRPIRKVRQSVNRMAREGYVSRVYRVGELDADARAKLEAVSHEWLGAWPERGFTMAMDGLFNEAEPVFVAAVREDGGIDGFIQLCPAGNGYSLSCMRRRRHTPNGLMEFLVAESVAWAREERVAELSLNFCVFGDVLLPGGRSPLVRLLRFGLQRLDRIFQLERLLSFTRKFFPDWRPRYLCFERVIDLPAVAFAYLHAESLLTPPKPWARERRPVLAA